MQHNSRNQHITISNANSTTTLRDNKPATERQRHCIRPPHSTLPYYHNNSTLFLRHQHYCTTHGEHAPYNYHHSRHQFDYHQTT